MLAALIILPLSFMTNCASSTVEEVQMNDSTVVVGIKNYDVNDSDVGVLIPWRKYYQKHPAIGSLVLGEREMVDCLERATKKSVLIQPTNVYGKWFENGTWTKHSLQENVRHNKTDVVIRLLYASHEKNRGVDFVWDMGRVNAELVVRNDLSGYGDLFTSKIGLGLATLATVAAIVVAFAVYLATTSRRPTIALFQGISLISQGVNEIDFVHTKAFSSGRMILIMGALASVVCMSIYTAGLASRIASVKQIQPTMDELSDLGYTWVMTSYQNISIVTGKPDFLTESLQQRRETFKKISEDTIIAGSLRQSLAMVLYGNKTSFLVHKSGALRRTEDGFAKSELGKLSYAKLNISRMASLPMTKIQSRRKVVVDALIKIKESGVLKYISNLWLGNDPKKYINQPRDKASFLPAGLIQTKSVFVALVFGQGLAVAIGLLECLIGRSGKNGTGPDIKPMEECPTCKRPYDTKQENKLLKNA